jgi:DNA-binding MarR family transcriptional regulator
VGVTGAQLFVLQVLARAPGSSINDLAARTFTHQSTVSVVVSRLVRRGLVDKRRAARDGRRVELRLSARGSALLRRAPRAAHARLVAALGRLPAAEGRRLSVLLERLVAAMGLTRAPAPMLFDQPTDSRPRRLRRAATRRDGWPSSDGADPGAIV